MRPHPAEAASADAALFHAIDRASRAAVPQAALGLHLSLLPAPGPQPHHGRVARAVLDDAARFGGGQVFARPGGDLLMLAPVRTAAALTQTLAELFGSARMVEVWNLPTDLDALHSHLAVPAPPAFRRPEARSGLAALSSAGAVVAQAPLAELARRQTAVLLHANGAAPLYQELTVSSAAVAARSGEAAEPDPFLFRHLATRLDALMLDGLLQHLDEGELFAGPRLHVNLTVPAVASAAFERVCRAAAGAGLKLAVEVAFIEACADLPGFQRARATLDRWDTPLVLDGIGHAALLLADPDGMGAELMKLEWSPRMAELPPGEALGIRAAIGQAGAERFVLHRAESDAAIAWGRAHGIRRFQGRQVDAMLAATRMRACRHATGCAFRQCMDRAAAIGVAGRAGCRNLALLDAAGLSPP